MTRSPSQRGLFWLVYGPTLVASFVLTSLGTLNPLFHPPRNDLGTRFFRAQLESLLDGRLDVRPGDLFGECFYVADLCYGYFGVTPSLLRLPMLVLAGGDSGNGWSNLYTFLAMQVGVIASLGLVRASLAWRCHRPPHDVPRWPLFIGYLLVGPASLLFLLGRSAVYEEALAWGASLSVAALWAAVTWLRTGQVSALVWVVALSTLAGNARIGFALSAAALGVILTGVAWRRGATPLARVLGLATVIVPSASALAVNWAKFGSLLPDLGQLEGLRNSALDLAALERTSYAYTDLGYVPTKLLALLRPWGLSIDSRDAIPVPGFPSDLIYLPGTPVGGIAYAPTPSLALTSPLALALSLAVLLLGAIGLWTWARHRRPPEWATAVSAGSDPVLPALLTASAGVALAGSLTFYSLTLRYLVDGLPLLASGTALGVVLLDGMRGRRRSTRPLVTVGATALAGWSVLIVWWIALGSALPLTSPLPTWMPSSTAQRVVCPQVAAWVPGSVDGLTRACAELAEDRQGLTPEDVAVLAGSANTAVRTLAAIRATDPATLTELAGDDYEGVRVAAAANPSLPGPIQQALAGDAPAVQLALAGNIAATPEVLASFAASEIAQLRLASAANPSLDPATLTALAVDENGKVRLAVAQNPTTPEEGLILLRDDEIAETAEIARRRLQEGTFNR